MTKPPSIPPRESTTLSPQVNACFGRYRILERLGKGGVGEVFHAEDTKIGRHVALKLLHTQEEPAGPGLTRAGAKRLLREARTTAKVPHPNAVVVFDAGEQDGTPYLVMELVIGRTLRSFVGDSSVFAVNKMAWLIDVAYALDAAHAKGIVHQDVKPENVMLRWDGVIKVLDFGIARRVVDTDAVITGDGGRAIYGTPAYVAPERAQGQTGNALADQFSWGVLAYELLVGEHPWGVDSPLTQLTEHVLARGVPAPPDAKEPSIPKEVGRVILRTLSARPKDRFPSMKEVIDAIVESWSDVVPLKTEASSERWWLAPWRARSWQTRAKACGAIAAAAAIALATASMLGGGPPPVAPPAPATQDAGWPDFGSKMSANPAALAAYRDGMASVREASGQAGRAKFSIATRHDPWFAAARLRRVLATPTIGDEERDDLLKATQFRDTLGEHDRALLTAIAPWREMPPNSREVEARLTALAQTSRDADYLLQLCRFRIFAGNYARATDACRAAREIDPTFAAAYWLEGQSLLGSGDTPGGSAALEGCLRLAPKATSCLNDFLQLRAREGACDVALTTTEKLMAADPDNYNWRIERAVAQYAVGRGLDEVTETVRSAMLIRPARERQAESLSYATKLAVLDGDFDGARKALDDWELVVASSGDEAAHLEPFRTRAWLSRELGEEKAFAARANHFLASRAALEPSNDRNQGIDAIVARYRAGDLPRREFVEARDTWWTLAKADHERDPRVATNQQWIAGFGDAIVTREDAEDALAVLPEPPPDRIRSAAYDAQVGEAELATKHVAEAVEHLRRATRMCKAVLDPFHHTWASLLLGEALESTSPKDACQAYRVVIDRWGKAGRASRSGATALDRYEALGCK